MSSDTYVASKRERDKPRSRNVKLTDAEWSALERIAREQGFEWGGIPSRSEAVRWLIQRYGQPE